MSVETVLHLTQTVIMTMALAGVALLRWGARGGKVWADFQKLEVDVSQLRTLFTEAGQKTSRLATEVQGMSERLRQIFITRDEATLMRQASEEDRAQLRREVERLWDAVRGKRE